MCFNIITQCFNVDRIGLALSVLRRKGPALSVSRKERAFIVSIKKGKGLRCQYQERKGLTLSVSRKERAYIVSIKIG